MPSRAFFLDIGANIGAYSVALSSLFTKSSPLSQIQSSQIYSALT